MEGPATAGPRRGSSRALQVGPDGAVAFEIDQPAGYRFLRYTVER